MTRAYNTATTQQNSGGAVNPFVAGKNKIINGDFGIWQRSTSFVPTSSTTMYGSADRWQTFYNGSAVGTNTVSRQTFTVGQTAVPGNPTYFIRTTTNGSATQNATDYYQRIEDVSTFAGQTVTLSFWAQASNSGTIALYVDQNFGSGGSTTVEPTITPSASNFTTTWARYTATVTLPSISGKTVGAGNFVGFRIRNFSSLVSGTFDLAQVQLESGPVATPFQTATGTIQGELAACQRYYQKSYNQATNPATATAASSIGMAAVSTGANANIIPARFPVVMRTSPTVTIYSPNTGTSGKIGNMSASSDVNATDLESGSSGFSIYVTGAPGGAVGYWLAAQYQAVAEL